MAGMPQPITAPKDAADLTAQLSVSPGALDFVRQMLQLDPEKRPSSLDGAQGAGLGWAQIPWSHMDPYGSSVFISFPYPMIIP